VNVCTICCVNGSGLKVNKKIGEGVFGEVYSASHDGDSVALKVISPAFVHHHTLGILSSHPVHPPRQALHWQVRGLREVQVICIQTRGAQSTRTCYLLITWVPPGDSSP